MIAHRNIFRIFSFLFVCMFVLASAPLHTARAVDVHFVKPAATGTGDCSSWVNACTLQTALTSPASGQEIWVAAGTYKPGIDPSATFQLVNDVAVYGGFAGTENDLSLRNPAANLTILSGDVDNNDTQTPVITNLATVTGNTTNAYHVVTISSSAILDGFTITAGYAGGSAPNNLGGGLYSENNSPILNKLIFSGNYASNAGGGLFDEGSNLVLTNITFSNNGTANAGAGIFNSNSNNMTLTNVTFSNNSASIYAGGMFNWDSNNINLTNVTFNGNSASSYGGGIVNRTSSPTLTNVTLTGNSAEYGGGLWNVTSSNPVVRNSIFWGNTAPNGPQIYNWEGSSSVAVSDSIIQSGYPGTNVITTDPLLGPLGDHGGYTQTVPIQSGSSAVDTGNDTVCPAQDQRGVTRPQGPHCDIGAYELDITPPAVLSSVRANANPTHAASVAFTVTFSEAVTGVDATDFVLTKTSGISGESVTGVSGGPTIYTVNVNTGTGDGTLRLDVTDNDSILDMSSNPLGGVGTGNGSFTSGEIYTIIKFLFIYLPLVVH